MNYPQTSLASRCFASPLGGGTANGRAKPVRGGRWRGLLCGPRNTWLQRVSNGSGVVHGWDL